MENNKSSVYSNYIDFYNVFFALGGSPINSKWRASLLYKVYTVFLVFCTYTTLSAIVLETYIHINDIDQVMESSLMIPPFLMGPLTHLFLRVKYEDVVRLLKITNKFSFEDIPDKDPDTGNPSTTSWLPIIKKTARTIATYGITFHIIQNVVRIAFSEERALSFKAWYPYDTTVSPYFEVTMIVQGFGSFLTLCFVYMFPPFYATLVCIACNQLEKVRASLMKINQSHASPHRRIYSAIDGSEELEQRDPRMFQDMQNELIKCIRLHQDILKYIEAIQETFSPLMLGLFFIYMGALCFSAFSLVTRWGDIMPMGQSILVYVIVLFDAMALCWFSSELSDQAERVRNAAWACDWVGTPKSFQRSVQFIIAAANKDTVLTAGSFVPVSKITLMNMIQESISLFMFLLHMKDSTNDISEEPII